MDDAPSSTLGELLSLAAHELRSPASVVAGYLRMLQRDSTSPLTERQRKLIDEAEKSCSRLVALISEMSDLAKLDANTAAVHTESFDLFSLIRALAKDVHESEERDVTLDIRGQLEGAPMTGDRFRLEAAFRALFRAVLREQPAACTVAAECRLEPGGAGSSALVVIAREPAVQSAYAAARGPFNELRGGLGLALPIARRVIAGHGGAIWSPATDDGTRGAILVSMPLREQKP